MGGSLPSHHQGPGSIQGREDRNYVPQVANAVPHLRVTWDTQSAKARRHQDGPDCSATGSPVSKSAPGSRQQLQIGVWMMEPGEDAIVGERIRSILAST